jgi:hypothetical protein
MRALIAAAALALGLAWGALAPAPAAAHQAPCEPLGPGHSAFARHHVVPLAQERGLGAGGHVPGTHRGYAGLCGVQAGG